MNFSPGRPKTSNQAKPRLEPPRFYSKTKARTISPSNDKRDGNNIFLVKSPAVLSVFHQSLFRSCIPRLFRINNFKSVIAFVLKQVLENNRKFRRKFINDASSRDGRIKFAAIDAGQVERAAISTARGTRRGSSIREQLDRV